MGWGSGNEIAREVWGSVKDHLSPLDRKNFANDLIRIFEDADCDTMYECEEIQKAAKMKF